MYHNTMFRRLELLTQHRRRRIFEIRSYGLTVLWQTGCEARRIRFEIGHPWDRTQRDKAVSITIAIISLGDGYLLGSLIWERVWPVGTFRSQEHGVDNGTN